MERKIKRSKVLDKSSEDAMELFELRGGDAEESMYNQLVMFCDFLFNAKGKAVMHHDTAWNVFQAYKEMPGYSIERMSMIQSCTEGFEAFMMVLYAALLIMHPEMFEDETKEVTDGRTKG